MSAACRVHTVRRTSKVAVQSGNDTVSLAGIEGWTQGSRQGLVQWGEVGFSRLEVGDYWRLGGEKGQHELKRV
jgi:hypothetical protein